MEVLARARILAGVAPLAIIAATLLSAATTSAEDPATFSEYDIKAAFLINFAKYVEWPKSSFEQEDAPFKIGVFGNNPFGDTLVQLASEQRVGERAIEVTHAEQIKDLTSCHLIFFGVTDTSMESEAFKTLEDLPILTVGERKGFADRNGTINFVIVDTKVKFETNLKVAKKHKLKISAQLLKVSIKVID